MPATSAHFLPPMPLRDLLAVLDASPSLDPWPLVPLNTRAVDMETPVTLWAFDRDEALSDDEYEAFEQWALAQGYEIFLSQQQLADVRDSLAHEIETLRDPRDMEIARRNYDAILIRAINRYREMDDDVEFS